MLVGPDREGVENGECVFAGRSQLILLPRSGADSIGRAPQQSGVHEPTQTHAQDVLGNCECATKPFESAIAHEDLPHDEQAPGISEYICSPGYGTGVL